MHAPSNRSLKKLTIKLRIRPKVNKSKSNNSIYESTEKLNVFFP